MKLIARLLGRPRAIPGYWYADYNAAWHAAHPGAFERQDRAPGSFFAGDVWVSSTPGWDRQWFKNRGYGMPRRCQHVELDKNLDPAVSAYRQ